MNTNAAATASNLSSLVGRDVRWRLRDNLPGVVIGVLDGCNPLFRVAFEGRDSALLPAQDLTFPDCTPTAWRRPQPLGQPAQASGVPTHQEIT